MHMNHIFVLSLSALTLGQLLAGPPYFSTDCAAEVPYTGTPEIVFNPAETRKSGRNQFLVQQCFRLGGTCLSDAECRSPTFDECKAAATDTSNTRYSTLPGVCIEGICRYRKQKVGQTCDCLLGCHFKTNSGSTQDQSCIGGKCVAAPCAPCGEPPNNRVCCGSGVVDHQGICHCTTGAGEGCATDVGKCERASFNDMCCGKGTIHEGKCCSESSCNSIVCFHQPKRA